MTKQTDSNYRIQLAQNAIYDLGGGDIEFAGGGRGQIARIETDNGVVEVKATSRAQAAEDLLAALQAFDAENADEAIDEIDADLVTETKQRLTDDAAIQILRERFGDFNLIDRDPTDDDQQPGPIWEDGVLVEIVPCVAECMDGRSDICECKCMGANHGLAGDAFAVALASQDSLLHALETIRPTMHGPKPCLCGCGTTTLRKFAPGHDAKYHGRIKREQQAAERGISVEEVPAALARERRARKKAEREAEAAKAESAA